MAVCFRVRGDGMAPLRAGANAGLRNCFLKIYIYMNGLCLCHIVVISPVVLFTNVLKYVFEINSVSLWTSTGVRMYIDIA